MKTTSLRCLGSSVCIALLLVLASCASDGDDFTATPVTVDPPAGAATTVTPSTDAPTTISAPTATTSAPTTTTSEPTTTTSEPTTTVAPTTTTVAPTTIVPTATTLVPAAAEPAGTVTHETIVVDGIERTYRLYVPSALPDGPVPLFIAMHGGGGWGDQFAQTNHVESLAESNNFVVIHPDGVKVLGGPGGAWNAGACCGAPARTGVDDVAFVSALIDTMEVRFDIDATRVFAFGHSNGAMMSYRLACELSDRIVGIGMWAGALEIDSCTPTRPVSVIQGHGDMDLHVPLEGGNGSEAVADVDFNPPHDGFDTVADASGCDVASTSTEGDVAIELRSPCAAGVAAEFVTIHTANHSWPEGTPGRTPASGAGYAGWDATAQIVGFLLAHPRVP